MEPIKAVSPTVSGNHLRLRFGAALSLPRRKTVDGIVDERIDMKQNRLNLYLIDMKYIRNLAKADDHVMSVSPQIEKETRPFVGIVVVCGTLKYCIPLSSPKPKHASMKNDVDFTKIMDGEKLIGVLNFNNMIPVDESCVIPLNLRISGKDDAATRKYKKMAVKQLDWCQRNQESIVKKANKLYVLVQSEKVSGFLKRRCCDFKRLEKVLRKWSEGMNN